MKSIKGPALRKLAGILLIIIAVALLAFWEAAGREAVLMDRVLVAKGNIEASKCLTRSMLKTVSVPTNAKVAEAVDEKSLDAVIGMESTAFIPEGGQLSKKVLRRPADADEAEEAYVVLRNEWIYMCPDTLREGDEVELVSEVDGDSFGRFKLTAVGSMENGRISAAGETRIKPGDQRSYIEIAASLETYFKIKSYAVAAKKPSLVIVKRRQL